MPQEAGMHMHMHGMHPEQLQLAAAHLPAEDEAAVERSGCPGSNPDRSPSPSPSPNPSPNPTPATGPDPSVALTSTLIPHLRQAHRAGLCAERGG